MILAGKDNCGDEHAVDAQAGESEFGIFAHCGINVVVGGY